jgi:hypothetical protein
MSIADNHFCERIAQPGDEQRHPHPLSGSHSTLIRYVPALDNSEAAFLQNISCKKNDDWRTPLLLYNHHLACSPIAPYLDRLVKK